MKKYKRLPHHSPEQLKRLQEIGDLKDCPIAEYQRGGNQQGMLADVITWLRLQHYRLEYRLLYYDMAVCCAYILFMFSALKLTTVIPQSWFAIATVAALLSGCILFIAVHILPNNKARNDTTPDAWAPYCSTLKHGVGAYRIYLIILALIGILFWHNENNLDGRFIVFIMPLAAIHFGTGLKMLTSNLKAKRMTEEYLRLAGKNR